MVTGGVLQALQDVTFFIQRQNKAVWFWLGPHKPGKSRQYFLEQGVWVHLVHPIVSDGKKCQPEGAPAVGSYIVRETRQVVSKDFRCPGFWPFEPVVFFE